MKAIKIFEIDLPKWPMADFISFVDKKVEMEKGEFILINIKGNKQSIIIACPKCGAKRGVKSHTISYTPNISVTPSLNNNDGGCCDYHGFLTNGVLTGI